MGSTGDSYDNALPKTINGLYKAEMIRRRGLWKSREAIELATQERSGLPASEAHLRQAQALI